MIPSAPPPGFVISPSLVEGIEVYVPATKPPVSHEEVLHFICPQCGAATKFDVRAGQLACPNCGYKEASQAELHGKAAEEYEFTVEMLQAASRGWGVDRKEIECQNCGSRTSIPPESLTHTCAFCGSNKVIQRPAPAEELRPRFLIPFKIDAVECTAIARKWLGSSWMAVKDLQNLASLARFTAVYLPYWTFDAQTRAAWRAEVGHTVTEQYRENGEIRTRTRTEWRWESGNVTLTFDDLLISGGGKVSRLLLGNVTNHNLGELTAYEPRFLAGIQAQAYEIPLEQAWEAAREQMREKTRLACRNQASSSQIRNFSMSLDFADESWRYILLPFYLAVYSYEGKQYQVLVNGQTAAIAGQRPVDWGKVWLVIAALLAPGLMLGLAGLITLPIAGIGAPVGLGGFVLLLLGVISAIFIFLKAQSMDDA